MIEEDPMQLLVDAFSNGSAIPKRYSCEGEDVSPQVRWSGEPKNTRSFVLIVDDPDAPSGTWVHWLQYDIPATVHELPEAIPPSRIGLCGTNSFGQPRYGGPCPPKGHGPHRYYFRLYALDTKDLGLNAGVGREQLERVMKPHVIAQAEYMGRYERR